MGKKVIGLALSVALLMVVLSGCFLLPKPDTVPPTVVITSPTNGMNFEILPGGTKNVTVEASVTAHSPIQSVVFTLTSASLSQTVSAHGPIGQTSGTFTYTFENLTTGKYSLSVEAYSSARFPGRASSKFDITATKVYQNPVVGDITLTPNYQGHYVTNSPITFSATVTNPNNTGSLNVTATVNGNPASLVSSNNGVYTFTYTPTTAGTYTFAINAVLTIDSKTYTGSNSKVEQVYEKPAVSNLQSPKDYSVATTPASFTFTTTSGVTAYLSVNGSTHAPYTSGTTINLVPNQWNTLILTFQDPWGNYLSTTTTVHVLGVKSSNSADTPYVFLIDKDGHVVNTNDWIHVAAGSKIDLYGYILKGKNNISNYNIQETYYKTQNLTTTLYGPGSVASKTNLSASSVPLRLVAYLLNPQATDTFIKFDILVNNSAAAFLRYDVAPVGTNSVKVTVDSNGTYEGAPATVNVDVNSVQPITSVVLGQPFKVGTPFDGYATTTAYSNSQNETNTMTFSVKYIVPVKDVVDINSYGTAYGTFPYSVAFYGPSGEYQIGATVTAIANQSTYATTTYKVQADTAAPTIKITPAGSYTTINNVPVYYGPMTVTSTITDDHAIYWAGLSFNGAAPTIFATYLNNSNIANYGVTATSLTATVPFTQGVGTYTVYAVASDKHFDPTQFWTGNTAQSVPSISVLYDNGSELTAKSAGGQYNVDVNSETYAFVVSASDGNGVGLSGTAIVNLIPVGGAGNATVTINAQLSASGSTPTYYNATINTYEKLTNKTQYKVVLGIKDKIYDALYATNPSTALKAVLAQHIKWVDWGYITVDHVYPNVGLYEGNINPFDGSYHPTLDSTSVASVSGNTFTVGISNDPYFPWAVFAENNYNQLLNYVNVQIGPENGPVSAAQVVPIKVSQTSTQSGYFVFELPGLYKNVAQTNNTATMTVQVSVYNSIQPDKALFGQTLAVVKPDAPFQISFSNSTGISQSSSGKASFPMMVTGSTYTLDVSVSGLPTPWATGMQLIFMADATPIKTVVPAADGTYTLNIPVSAGTSLVSIRVLYAPIYYNVPGVAPIVTDYNPPANYDYYRNFSTLYVLGDNVLPTSHITLNGADITSQSTIITSSFTPKYSVNGVNFWLHDFVSTFASSNINTTVDGTITISTYASPTFTTLSTPTLTSTDTLNSAGFVQESQWTISKLLSVFDKAGIYKIKFTANDPLLSSNTANATVVVDLAAPDLTTAVTDATSGVVPAIVNGGTLTVSATDDTGVQSISGTITNLIYNVSNSLTSSLSNSGIGAFNATANATVTLPTVFAPQFQNVPYEVTFSAKDVAGRYSNTVTRLFVTNIDHSPYVSKIIAVATNKALVRLTEPTWANGFKAFTANSATYGGTITSADITPVNLLASYKGYGIANEFYVTFPYDVWTTAQVGNDVRTDLFNVQMSSDTASYVPIVDLAGNQFIMPINTTVPPVFTVTPLSTTVGKGWNVTFTVSATSVAGIQKIVGNFEGQTQVVYAATGTMTFVAPTPSTSTTYDAYFTAYDNSVNQNTANATASVYVNAVPPTISSFTAPATVANGVDFTATVSAVVGDSTGGNRIASVKINGINAVNVSGNTWEATLTLSVNGIQTLAATVTDKYGNISTQSTTLYVDGLPPTITVKFVGTGSSAATATLDPGTTATVYATSGAKVTFTATDDSNAMVTLYATASTATTSWSSHTSAITAKIATTIVAPGTYTITASATDEYGHSATFNVATLTVVIDSTLPTVPVATPATVLAASSTAIATYTATDTNFKSAYLEVFDTNGTLYSTTLVAPVQSATVNLRTDLNGLDGATVTVSIVATDLAGNVSSASATFYVDTVDPTMKDVYRATSASSSPIYIVFSEPISTTTGFASSDITFISQTTGYEYAASNVTKTPTALEITVFDLNGVAVKSANLPSATYTVTVGNYVVDKVGNPVGNNGSYWSIGQ